MDSEFAKVHLRPVFGIIRANVVMSPLLLIIPLALIARYLQWSPSIVFFLNFASCIPLSWIMGEVTEFLADHTTEIIGALLNVSFGNFIEIILCYFALGKNDIIIVQSSLMGAFLSNLLFVLGLSLLVGGFFHKNLKYPVRGTSVNSSLLTLSMLCIVLPTAYAQATRDTEELVMKISRIISILLIVSYFQFLYFQIVSHSEIFTPLPEPNSPQLIDYETLQVDTDSNNEPRIFFGDTVNDMHDIYQTFNNKNNGNHGGIIDGGIRSVPGSVRNGGSNYGLEVPDGVQLWPIRSPSKMLVKQHSRRQSNYSMYVKLHDVTEPLNAFFNATSPLPVHRSSPLLPESEQKEQPGAEGQGEEGTLDLRKHFRDSNVSGSLLDEMLVYGGSFVEGIAAYQGTISLAMCIILLSVSAFFISLSCWAMMESLEGTVKTTGLSREFIGIVLLPVVTNAAEVYTATMFAVKNRINLSLSVSLGSTLQIALFTTPTAVLMGWAKNVDITLNFAPFQALIFFVVVMISTNVLRHGSSTWLEGSMLLTTYSVIAIIYFYQSHSLDPLFYPDT